MIDIDFVEKYGELWIFEYECFGLRINWWKFELVVFELFIKYCKVVVIEYKDFDLVLVFFYEVEEMVVVWIEFLGILDDGD